MYTKKTLKIVKSIEKKSLHNKAGESLINISNTVYTKLFTGSLQRWAFSAQTKRPETKRPETKRPETKRPWTKRP